MRLHIGEGLTFKEMVPRLGVKSQTHARQILDDACLRHPDVEEIVRNAKDPLR